MDARVDLTENRDFRDVKDRSSGARLPSNITIKIEKIISGSNYKKINFKNNKLIIDFDNEISDNDFNNRCHRCGRKILNYGLCSRCENSAEYD